jgi:glycosyltransferase involved in cell wall biosynthesis
MGKTKILFLSDAVSAKTGLARITRDLATRVHQHLGDIYEVASVGYGAPGSASIPFRQYHLSSVENWLVPELPSIWDDFTQGQEGVLMTVWDASRLYWLGNPATSPMPHLRRFAERKHVKKWLYGAIDAEGPNGRLPYSIAETCNGFDRVIEYSEFASRITGYPDHLPHGIDTKTFCCYPREKAREDFAKAGFCGLAKDSFLIGIVGTNQQRKNWALGFQTARLLLDSGLDVRVWAHTDVLDRYWSLGNLVVDYGLQGRVAITTINFSDAELAQMYSACNVTLGIGPEGFGYPIAESLACQVPCVCGSYGGQAEFVPKEMQVDPIAYTYEGAFCSKRPVHLPEAWANRVLKIREAKEDVVFPVQIDWNGPILWPAWEGWFREGAL